MKSLVREIVVAVAATAVEQAGEGIREALARRAERDRAERERWEAKIAAARQGEVKS